MSRNLYLLWTSEQTPKVNAPGLSDEASSEIESDVETLINVLNLETTMLEATMLGQVGSVAIVVRAKRNGLPFFECIKGKNCQPIFDNYDPDELVGMIQIYHVDGSDLLSSKKYLHDAAGKPIKKD